MDFNIVTFHRAHNYGAVLQAYALQEFIKSAGYTAGVYDYAPVASPAGGGIKGKILKLVKKSNRKANQIKAEKYKSFVEDNLNLNKDLDSDIYVSGSDQVWNAFGKMDSAYFLRFVKNDAMKISYAASMGVDRVPEERKALFKKYIDCFDRISVREEGAKECLNQLCEKDISVHLDPTLLMDEEFWLKQAEPINGIPEKYILVYLMHLPKNLNKLLKWLKKELGTDIVVMDSQGIVQGGACCLVKHDIALHEVGPKQFLWLMANAQSVVTSSFHGTAFSIIFRKEFYSIINPSAPSRIKNLLNKLGLSAINENDLEFTRFINNDWSQVERVLNFERERSRCYIQEAYLNRKTHQPPSHGTVAKLKDYCMGCFACEAACPTGAICMRLNASGFYEPFIDEDKCVCCGKCEKTCPQNKALGYKKKKSWYGWVKNDRLLYNSTSGGIFGALAEQIQASGGAVFGAIYSENFKDVVFDSTDNVGLDKMQKSKYTVSNPCGLYQGIEMVLKSGRQALFCGTPCQVAGLKQYFGNNYTGLTTVDFVCGGMSSLHFWREHIDHLEKKYGAKIKSVDFRSKRKGWGKCRLAITFENGKKLFVREYRDIYYKMFMDHITVRETCLACELHDRHSADITIADFWGYRAMGLKDISKGISLVMANTDTGVHFIENLPNAELFPLEDRYSDYAVSTANPSIAELSRAQKFFAEAKTNGFEKTANKQFSATTISHIIKWAKRKLKL